MLSETDCHVFRFDYFGTGDSAGHGDQVSIERWKADIVSAFYELKDVSGVNRMSVVGARFGACLALASTDSLHIDNFVLWDPVVSGKNYLYELEALHNNRNCFSNTNDPQNLQELMGYPLPSRLRNEIEQIDLLSLTGDGTKKISLISSENKEENFQLLDLFNHKGINFEIHRLDEPCSWQSPEDFDQTLIVNQMLHKIREIIVGK